MKVHERSTKRTLRYVRNLCTTWAMDISVNTNDGYKYFLAVIKYDTLEVTIYYENEFKVSNSFVMYV